jgi:YggT family protein
MTPSESLIQHWYFHLPNLTMAALMYTLIGAYIIALFFKPDSEAVILRAFNSIANPFLRLVRGVTPAIVPDGLMIVFAIVWLMALRLFWFLTCLAAGMRLQLGG